MPGSLLRRTAAVAFVCAFVLAGSANTATRPATRIAVGDIASCSSDGDEQTAALVWTLRGPIAVMGDIAYDNGTAGEHVVLLGHDHDYERFTPLRGIRSFVVGTGGKGHRGFTTLRPGSVARNSDTFGVLRLTLRPTGYDWRFLPVTGGTFSDAGTARCR